MFLIFGHFYTFKLSGWENMFHCLARDMLKKKRQTQDSTKKREKRKKEAGVRQEW